MATELPNNGRTGQIQYSPTFSKQGYKKRFNDIAGKIYTIRKIQLMAANIYLEAQNYIMVNSIFSL